MFVWDYLTWAVANMTGTCARSSADDRGFTLVELLVVAVITGVLAAIAIPIFLDQRQAGWQAQLTSDVRNSILDVEAQFVNNNGEYPADQDEFDLLRAETSDDAITLTYTTNGNQSEFCVLGRDTRQPPGDRQLAHYVSGSGVRIADDCPNL